jgi:2-phospho-L-lactate guanylyltransferase
LQNTATTWAIVPIKDFARAKSRLGAILTAEQCTALARHMADDVIGALCASDRVAGITLLGAGSDTAAFATTHGCAFLPDIAGGLSVNLARAAAQLAGTGVARALIVPTDLPMVTASDIDTLLADHADDLTVCRAARDGGTNALVVSPPDAIPFRFGEHSATRHMDEGRAAGLRCRLIADGPFSRDVDRPDDLAWFCREFTPGSTTDYLDRSGIRAQLLDDDAVMTA